MLDKKQSQAIFLFKFKVGHKAAETTRIISNMFGPGTAKEHTVQWWLKEFCKRDESLEDEERSNWPSEADNDQLRGSLKLIFLQPYEMLPKNSTKTILRSFSIWSKSERCKSSLSGCLKSWPQIRKIVILKSHLLLFYTRMNHFLIRLGCETKSGILYEIMVTLWWSAASLIHHSFLNPGKTITAKEDAHQTHEMHWKLQHLQPALVNRKGPILLHNNAQLHITQPVLQKLNKLDWDVLPHSPFLPDLLPTNYQFFKHLKNFLQGKWLPQPTGGRKCFPRGCWIPKHGFLCCRNKQSYFSLAKMCLLY